MSTYQVATVAQADTFAHLQTAVQPFGAAFTTFGWTAVGGSTGATSANVHGEVVASGTGASYAWTNTGSVLALPTVVLTAQGNYRFNGTWVSGNSYAGSNVASNVTQIDLVTFATAGNTPVTYQKITGASSGTTNPPNDTTNWQPLLYEIWKSTGTNSTSLPIYIKLTYMPSNTTAANAHPKMFIQVGTSVDANGNLTGSAAVLASATPTTVVPVVPAASASSATAFDMDFSGDADNIRWIVWRGSTAASSDVQVFVCDRSKTATGTDSDAFAYLGVSFNNAGTPLTLSSILLNATLGSPINQCVAGWTGVVATAGVSTAMSTFGTVPTFPIFPIVGYIANPLLGAVGMNHADVVDGQVYPVWMYGSSHNYLVQNIASAGGNCLYNNNNSIVPAIRWE